MRRSRGLSTCLSVFLLITLFTSTTPSVLKAEALGGVDCNSSVTKEYSESKKSGGIGKSEAEATQSAITGCGYTLQKAAEASAGEVDCGICLNPWGCDGSVSSTVISSNASGTPSCWKNSSSPSGGSGGGLGDLIGITAIILGGTGSSRETWTCYVDCSGKVNVTHSCTPCVGWICDLFGDSEEKAQCESLAEDAINLEEGISSR